MQQAVGITKCDHPQPFTNDFQALSYMGQWFEQVHVIDQPFQKNDAVCTYALYEDFRPDGHFVVYNTGQPALNADRTMVVGDAYCPDTSGHCYVEFYDAPYVYPNYKVIETDYVSYSIVYACDVHQYVWFLSRDPIISDELYQYMYDTAYKALPSFDWSNLNERTYQGAGCDYQPEAMF